MTTAEFVIVINLAGLGYAFQPMRRAYILLFPTSHGNYILLHNHGLCTVVLIRTYSPWNEESAIIKKNEKKWRRYTRCDFIGGQCNHSPLIYRYCKQVLIIHHIFYQNYWIITAPVFQGGYVHFRSTVVLKVYVWCLT